METFSITTRKTDTKYNMNEPHAHTFYELYLLLEGERELYYEDKIIHIPAKHFCVVPPFTLHKTEGGPHLRINVVLPKSLLSYQEINFLNHCVAKGALSFDDNFQALYTQLLTSAANINENEQKMGSDEFEEYKTSIIKTVLYYMQTQTLQSTTGQAIDPKNAPPIVSKLINYMHENYKEDIDLQSLSKQFFFSKTSICNTFKKYMNCTVITYLQRLRVNKAMDLLLHTKYGIEKISEECGFTSSSYFRYIFKKETGVSPLKYRK